jgi:MtN3 and saliva related transmembrane protein
MRRIKQVLLSVPLLTSMMMISGCEQLLHNTQSILIPSFQRSDLFGFVAGLEPPLPSCQTCWRCSGAGRVRA